MLTDGMKPVFNLVPVRMFIVFAFAGDGDGQAIFPAQLAAHVPYAVILVLISQKLQNHIRRDGRNTRFLAYQLIYFSV